MKTMEYRLYDYERINELFARMYEKEEREKPSVHMSPDEKWEWIEAKNSKRRLSSYDYMNFTKEWEKANESIPETIYYYEIGTHIDPDEVLTRSACEYFIKDGKVYRVVSTAEEKDAEVFYVEKIGEDVAYLDQKKSLGGIKIEIRRYTENSDQHPLVKEYFPIRHLDAMQKLNKDFLYVDGYEWKRDSAEIDEDRGTYVIYANPTGAKFV